MTVGAKQEPGFQWMTQRISDPTMRLSWVRFSIPGKPIPKARHRTTFRGRSFTPQKTVDYERHVNACGLLSLPNNWPTDADYMLCLRIWAHNKRRRDGDNILKSVQDGLIGVYWDDDHRVGTWYEPWRVDRKNPRVEVLIVALRPMY